MIIRKHANKNEYVVTADGLWVRNFNTIVSPIDLNELNKGDYKFLNTNEFVNSKMGLPDVEDIVLGSPYIIIVSDGYDFTNKCELLTDEAMKAGAIIGINGALKKWPLIGSREKKRGMVYLINNPYPEASSWLPMKHSYYPKCIASTRTNPEFIRGYRGEVFTYVPTPERGFDSSTYSPKFKIDDYRNPVCAALNIAHHMGAQRILLFCCDDAFEEDRPSSIDTGKDTRMYPQHLISQRLIDANLFWLKHKNPDIKIADYSRGGDYVNAEYINSEQGVLDFFRDEEDGQ
tara:strand:- start:7479 stop:8345 length:867 start_codon:yes stop_codon:yes gene_type:complete